MTALRPDGAGHGNSRIRKSWLKTLIGLPMQCVSCMSEVSSFTLDGILTGQDLNNCERTAKLVENDRSNQQACGSSGGSLLSRASVIRILHADVVGY